MPPKRKKTTTPAYVHVPRERAVPREPWPAPTVPRLSMWSGVNPSPTSLHRLRRITTFISTWFGAWLSRDQWVAGNHGHAVLLFIAAALTCAIIAWAVDNADDPWSDFYGIDGDD